MAARLTYFPWSDYNSLMPSCALLISGLYFPPQVGGISRQLHRVATLLGPDDVSVLTGVSGADHDGLRIRRVPELFNGTKLVKATSWARILASIFATQRPDLLLLGAVDDANVGLRLSKLLKTPIVLFAYGNEILSTIQSSYEPQKRVFRIANHVIACSKYSASLAVQAGTNADRVSVIYPRCDANIFRPMEVDADFRAKVLGARSRETKIILSVGNLVSRKGHDVAIASLQQVRSKVPHLMYLIIGDGPERGALEQMARDLGVADIVRFLGKVPDDELPLYYNLCDVFIMASRAQEKERDVEGFGIVFLEANACNKPVIGGRSGGVKEAVEEGVSGLLVDPHSSTDVASALISVLTNDDLARKLGEQGRARVLRDFGWDSYRDSLVKIMDAARAEGPVS